MKRTVENIKDPLFRFFEREVNTGARLLQDVRRDLQDVMKVCMAEKKPTNHHRSMMADLVKGKGQQSLFRFIILTLRKFILSPQEAPRCLAEDLKLGPFDIETNALPVCYPNKEGLISNPFTVRNFSLVFEKCFLLKYMYP
jgi:hypothetical protein